jgi:YD repeat-containing protein
LILPYKTQVAKGNANLQNQFQYTAYDSFGNLLELRKENGMINSYLYGYNHTQPIAKIENINNEQLKNILGVTNLELVDETYLPIINNLRSSSLLANAMITTYTYIPLIGISSITDPKGDRVDYIYDSFGRLTETKDINNNTLSKNEIHYKN